MTFKKFLKFGLDSDLFDGPESDFANDALTDKSFRPFKTWDALETYLMFNHRADKVVRKVAKECFKKWQIHIKKSAPKKIDGLSPHDIEKIKKALRKVWSWSHSRRLVVARCTEKSGFTRCEQCKKRCPQIYVDHITPVGVYDGEYIERLFVSSNLMQGLCGKCHSIKTTVDMHHMRKKSEDFF